MRVGQILLYSSDRDGLANCLSSLLDLEVESCDSAVTLSGDSLTISIFDSVETIKMSGTVIDIALDDLNLLHDLLRKVEFLNYRFQSAGLSFSDLFSEEGYHYFEMKDIDSRTWRFSAIC